VAAGLAVLRDGARDVVRVIRTGYTMDKQSEEDDAEEEEEEEEETQRAR
jgi:DNA-binding winged helix-turn-helix (wHTH) protein